MCGGQNDVTKTTGKGTAQTNQTTSYSPFAGATYTDILQNLKNVSQTPYTSITQGIAGFTPEQNLAMQTVNNAYSTSQPYMTQAAGLFSQAAAPLTESDINQYYNPYSGAVTKNLEEIFGQQMRDTTGKLTGAAGGLGADRIAVGQAELARQQGLAAGQTYASIWQNAMQAAQNQQGIEQASAYGLGNLSQAQLQQLLSQGAAQFGMGTAQQQTEQAKKDAAFAEQMRRAGYPIQMAQLYAQLAAPIAGQMGGTTTAQGKQTGTQIGTVNPPNPNPWSQAAGLAIAGLGAFAKRGGRIKGYATGGSPYGGDYGSYVPQAAGMQMSPMMPQSSPMQFMDLGAMGGVSGGSPTMGGVGGKGSNIQAGQGLRNLWDRFSGSSPASAGNMGWSTSVKPTMSGFGNMLSHLSPFNRGGGVHESEPMKILTHLAKGGKIEGYAYGGGPSPYDPGLLPSWMQAPLVNPIGMALRKPIEDRLAPEGNAPTSPYSSFKDSSFAAKIPQLAAKMQDRLLPEDSVAGGAMPNVPAKQNPMLLGNPIDAELASYNVPPGTKGYDAAGNPVVAPPPIMPSLGGPDRPVPGEALDSVESGIPPQAGSYDTGPEFGRGAGPAAPGGTWAQAIGSVGIPDYHRPTLFGKPLSNMNLALIAAGLGMMGGTSPYFATNIGEGGLKGVAALKDFQQMDAERQAKMLNNMLEAGRLDLGEKNYALEAWDKPRDDIKQQLQTAIYAGNQPEADRLTEMLHQYDLTHPIPGGSTIATPGAEATKPVPSEETKLPDTPYGSVEPPKLPYQAEDRFVREQNKALSTQWLKDAKTKYESSQSQNLMLTQMRHDFRELPKDGALVAGPGLQARNALAKSINTIYGALGMDPQFDPNQVSSIEELNKLTTRMGFDLARTLGTREAMQVIQQAVAAVPGSDNTPAGARKIMTGIQAAIDRDRDYYEFITKFAKKNNGDITGADIEFNKVRPPQYYVERSQEIAAAQELVYSGKMKQEDAEKQLKGMGIEPAEVF